MPIFSFAKLVRDKIVQHQIDSGAQPTYRTLDDQEYKQALVAKIAEEAQEVVQASADQIAAEIADVQQALDDLRDSYGIKAADVATAQQHKNQKNGAFGKRLYVETVAVDEENPWTVYYRQHSDRYPEINN